MTKEEYWKNFNIGTELQISGNFIYDGLLVFDQMESFYNEDEIFEFLYFIAAGLERLLKANIVLIEHSNEINQDELEQSLITHNHADLINRIGKKHQLNLGKVHKEFIQILTIFFKSFRYDRYCLRNYREFDKEKNKLINFIEKHMNIEISNEFLKITLNDKRIKKFIGKVIGKIVTTQYDILWEESHRLRLNTHEVRTFSKSYKIFMEKDFTFERERILQKEILVYLLRNNEDSGFKEHINEHLPSLDFSNGTENIYSKCLFNLSKCSEFLDELEVLYEDLKNKKDRFAAIDVIGSNIEFEKDFENEYDDEE